MNNSSFLALIVLTSTLAAKADSQSAAAPWNGGTDAEEQRSKRDAMAAPRAAWESVHRTTEMRRRCSGRRGWESVRSTTLATLDEQSGRRVGPTILFDPPRPPLLTSFFSLWAYS